MKRILPLILAAGCVLGMTSITHAQAIPVESGAIDYAGTGCPGGTANVSNNASDKNAASGLLFNNFTVRNERKNCAITIPLKVADGYQVAIPTITVKGYVAANTQAKLSVDAFFAGQSSTAITRTIQDNGNFEQVFKADSPSNWSKCGDSVNLRINVALIGQGAGEANLDTLEFDNQSLPSLVTYRTCH
jgi:hypothetical protein